MPHPIRTWDSQNRLKEKYSFTIHWSYSKNNTLLLNDIPCFRLYPELEDEATSTQAYVTVITGVINGTIVPWLNVADVTLMIRDMAIIPVDPQTVRIPLQLSRRRDPEGGAVIYEVSIPPPFAIDAPALLTLVHPRPNASISSPTIHFPQTPFSASPSTTLPIRRGIVYSLAPVAWTIAVFLQVAYLVVIYVGPVVFSVAVVWLLWSVAFGLWKTWKRRLMKRAPGAVTTVASADKAEADGHESKPEEAVCVPQIANDIV